MEYIHLGRTGLKVSRLCLGTMNIGDLTNQQAGVTIMDRALDQGINFFDTSPRYGQPIGEGITEGIIGRWMGESRRRREQIVLATKIRNPLGSPSDSRSLSARHIRESCEASLRRLQTDRIDLYQLYHVERRTPWEEIWQAMELLVQQGKILYVGSSNFAGWHIAQAQCIAAGRHFMGLVCEQSVYNLSNRAIELEAVPACRAFGLGLTAYSPLAAGLLGGTDEGPSKGRRSRPETQHILEQRSVQLSQYAALCNEIGAPPAQVALAWLLHQPVLTAPIIGPRTVEQLEGALQALDLKLDADSLQRLDEIWPGPGGEAPEAYAW